MRVILFGAGASKGSEQGVTVPPLGGELFDQLANWAPNSWGALRNPWPSRFRQDFEQAMAQLMEEGVFAARFQWDMAAFFFTQFTATHNSVYKQLIVGLSPRLKQFLFVTINYDLLLFQARTLAEVPADALEVCLPHGSSCLRCLGVTASHGVSFSGRVSTGGSVRPFRTLPEFKAERAKNVFPPVMSYFEPNKSTVSCSEFIASERARYEERVLAAERVAIVGVKVHPIDAHIWEPLAGASGASEFQQWSAQNSRVGDMAIPKYFRDGLPDLLEYLLSSEPKT
jgi:hypothetical protein